MYVCGQITTATESGKLIGQQEGRCLFQPYLECSIWFLDMEARLQVHVLDRRYHVRLSDWHWKVKLKLTDLTNEIELTSLAVI